MEQLYLVEIFVDKVYIFATTESDTIGANKKLIIKIKFGPKIQFIIKEGQLAVTEPSEDIVETDEEGHRKYCRTIRVGKSFLFPSYSDTVLMILEKFPLEIEVWNDDENEQEIFVGLGTMQWDTEFFYMLKETANADHMHDPLTIKTKTRLMAECCCKQCGEISLIVRISALGDSITTEFQQPMTAPDTFVFRTNKAPSTFECKRIEGDDPHFCMVGTLYETATLEDPETVNQAYQKIEVCTELQNCGTIGDESIICPHGTSDVEPKPKQYKIEKIRMGDIHGPCGNSNCPLAHKVRNYIRTLEAYKKEAAGKVAGSKSDAHTTQKICGGCSCKDDRAHRGECPDNPQKKEPMVPCKACGGKALTGDTCEDRNKNLFGTGVTPKTSKTHVAYVFSVQHVPDYKESMFGRDFIEQSLGEEFEIPPLSPSDGTSKSRCSCRKAVSSRAIYSHVSCGPDDCLMQMAARSIGINNPEIYNVEVSKDKDKEKDKDKGTNYSLPYKGCTDIGEEKDCRCAPPRPSPPCKTFDCDCITEIGNVAARKTHKPYCPLYKHKSNCPVTMMNEEEENKEDDDDAAEPLPYGLPPIKLGPCPIMGRPCSVPDGFARMYKNAAQPTLPPSYSDAGKVCCSKDYERIRKALKDYMKYEKENDWRCINKFNVDTEKRCCDKEQRLLSLMGKGCCGAHKLSIQEKYKDDHPKK